MAAVVYAGADVRTHDLDPDSVFDAQPVRRAAETIAFTVLEYDLSSRTKAVIGRRIDTQALVRVALTPPGSVPNEDSVYARPEIVDLASPRNGHGSSTEPGGVLLASCSYLLTDGSWSCTWLQPLSHFAGEADIFISTCSVIETRPGQPTERFPAGHPNFMVQFLSSGLFDGVSEYTLKKLDIVPPFKVNSLASLQEAGEHLLASKIGFGIRLSSPFDATEIHPWPVKHPDGSVLEPTQALARAIRAIQLRAPDLATGQCLCEVIPFQRVFAGAATSGHFATSRAARTRLSPFNTFGDATQTPGAFREAHFVPSIIAARLSKSADPRPFVTHVEPLRGVRPYTSLKESVLFAQTEHFSPERPDISSFKRGPKATDAGLPASDANPDLAKPTTRDSVSDPHRDRATSRATSTTSGRYEYRPTARAR